MNKILVVFLVGFGLGGNFVAADECMGRYSRIFLCAQLGKEQSGVTADSRRICLVWKAASGGFELTRLNEAADSKDRGPFTVEDSNSPRPPWHRDYWYAPTDKTRYYVNIRIPPSETYADDLKHFDLQEGISQLKWYQDRIVATDTKVFRYSMCVPE